MQEQLEHDFKSLRALINEVPPKNRFIWLDQELLDVFQYHFIDTMRELNVMFLNKPAFSKIPGTDDTTIIIICKNSAMAYVAESVTTLHQQNPSAIIKLFVCPRVLDNNSQLLQDLHVMDMIYQYEPTYISYYQTYDPNIYETQQNLNPFTDRLLLTTTFSDMLLHLTTA